MFLQCRVILGNLLPIMQNLQNHYQYGTFLNKLAPQTTVAQLINVQYTLTHHPAVHSLMFPFSLSPPSTWGVLLHSEYISMFTNNRIIQSPWLWTACVEKNKHSIRDWTQSDHKQLGQQQQCEGRTLLIQSGWNTCRNYNHGYIPYAMTSSPNNSTDSAGDTKYRSK